MKISKQAIKHITVIANGDPGCDIYRAITSTDAKVILEALGIKPRPTWAIDSLERSVKDADAFGPRTMFCTDNPTVHAVLDYIKQLEANQQ